MHKFIYTILIICLALWGLFAYILFNVSPESLQGVFIFITVLMFAMAFTFSVPIYFFYYKRAPTFSNLRYLYRKSLKWGVFFGASLCGYLLLRILKVDTLVNVGLLLLLVVSVASFLKGRR